MDELFRAIDGNRPGSLRDLLRLSVFDEPLFDALNRPSDSHTNCTPLLYALKRPGILPEIVQLLLEAGSCTEAAPFGALHCALTAHQPFPVIKLLFDFKADIYRCCPLQPVEVDDEKAAEVEEFSLLHLALFVGASREVVELFCGTGGSLLINNQQNPHQETPLIFAIKRGLNLNGLLETSDLSLLDGNGLSAYACAALTLNPSLCLQLECHAIASTQPGAFSFAQLRRSLHRFHLRDDLHLEILFSSAAAEGSDSHGGWCDFWGVFSEHGGPEHVSLPVNGYWQWCSDWQHRSFTPNTSRKNSPLPPPDCNVQWFRLRKRKHIETPFFAQAVALICDAEDSFYAAEMHVSDSLVNAFKEAFSLLINGIKTCEDAQLKARAADYLQLAMQRLESLAPDQSAFASSTLSLTTAALPGNESTASLPPVTKTFPLHRLASKIFKSKQQRQRQGSADELRYCPVCSVKLPSAEDERVAHLNACLTGSQASIRGDRYTVHVLSTPDPRECPICCEEFVGAKEGEEERIAVMNCLCRFHERCIERWFTRSPTCPFHS